MTAVQMGLTIAVCTAATMLTRFLPFVVFSSKDQQPPEVVRYLGRVLPAAIFGMLIVYCLKSVTPFAGSRGIPEAIALLVTVGLHKWKHETLLSVAGGTLCYGAAGAAGVLKKEKSALPSRKIPVRQRVCAWDDPLTANRSRTVRKNRCFATRSRKFFKKRCIL